MPHQAYTQNVPPLMTDGHKVFKLSGNNHKVPHTIPRPCLDKRSKVKVARTIYCNPVNALQYLTRSYTNFLRPGEYVFTMISFRN